ncbi:ABC-1 domain protein [Acidimicrobium ferrooxidans DSM 10331]|uniref:ABC-1 domain protein n=1 Tax=Acidimicrobium ferrooxidans (strain DSM 10331 / JCM 15462 / NBRC 103882 / ICP) TaxID=525909 RepID=C7LZ67_ACIFD|nr:ABC-1 domain protein [Acidimicrobium ferrooxidans DSM 10331]
MRSAAPRTGRCARGPGRLAIVASDEQQWSFTEHGPWRVEAGRLLWAEGVPALRARAQAQIPRLTAPRRVPPARRVLGTGLSLGVALGAWRLFDRPRGRAASRRGLSRRLRRAFETLGPTYIKLGQIISSGEGIFPVELVEEFKQLRDRVPAEPFAVVRSTIEEELDAPLEELFASFDPSPVAAASIAQVYYATLRDGTPVAVKVQRSRVAELVRRDLAAMAWITPHLVGRIPVAALANPPALVELFAETIVEELDFRIEAANMLDIAAVLAATEQRAIVVPRPHPEFVTRRVLVMERLDGYRWDDARGMHDAGIDTTEVVRAALVSFLEGAMLHGVFHGDLHGGNLFVQPDGTVALLDFGITGRLSEPKRLAFLRLLMAGSMNDLTTQVQALIDLGALPPGTDPEQVIDDLGLDQPAVDPTELEPEQLVAELQEITKALLGSGARMPKELMLFVKNMLFVDASLATLAPDIDLFAEIARLAAYFMTKYGARITSEIGVAVSPELIDLSGVKASLGVDETTEQLTYRELRERRELIRRRMEAHERGRRPGRRSRSGASES